MASVLVHDPGLRNGSTFRDSQEQRGPEVSALGSDRVMCYYNSPHLTAFHIVGTYSNDSRKVGVSP